MILGAVVSRLLNSLAFLTDARTPAGALPLSLGLLYFFSLHFACAMDNDASGGGGDPLSAGAVGALAGVISSFADTLDNEWAKRPLEQTPGEFDFFFPGGLLRRGNKDLRWRREPCKLVCVFVFVRG